MDNFAGSLELKQFALELFLGYLALNARAQIGRVGKLEKLRQAEENFAKMVIVAAGVVFFVGGNRFIQPKDDQPIVARNGGRKFAFSHFTQQPVNFRIVGEEFALEGSPIHVGVNARSLPGHLIDETLKGFAAFQPLVDIGRIGVDFLFFPVCALVIALNCGETTFRLRLRDLRARFLAHDGEKLLVAAILA